MEQLAVQWTTLPFDAQAVATVLQHLLPCAIVHVTGDTVCVHGDCWSAMLTTWQQYIDALPGMVILHNSQQRRETE